MAIGLEKYKKLLTDLLPTGRAWQQVRGHELFKGMAIEFCRVEERGADLLKEIGPETTTELLEDWENLLGLPDECTPEDQTINERRVQIAQKLGTLGGLNAGYYKHIASLLGFDIEIENPVPFRVGVARIGDALTNNSIRDTFSVGSNRVGEQLRVFGWQFYFIAKVPASELSKFRVGENRVGDTLVDFGNVLLQCTLSKYKSAESGIVFRFI